MPLIFRNLWPGVSLIGRRLYARQNCPEEAVDGGGQRREYARICENISCSDGHYVVMKQKCPRASYGLCGERYSPATTQLFCVIVARQMWA